VPSLPPHPENWQLSQLNRKRRRMRKRQRSLSLAPGRWRPITKLSAVRASSAERRLGILEPFYVHHGMHFERGGRIGHQLCYVLEEKEEQVF
jgi:hypothetical protein